MSASQKLTPIKFSAVVYLVLSLVTILGVFFSISYLTELCAGLICLFVCLEFQKIPLPQRISGTALLIISLLFVFFSGEWRVIIVEGVGRTSIFLLLFYAVSWLQFPVNESDALGALREHINSQPSGKRFIYLAFGVHSLGSILNIAGLSFLTSVVENEKNKELQRELSVTLILGFAAVSCWSPFFIGMIVVLVALPSLNWSDFAFFGMVMAFLIIAGGWFFDRISNTGERGNLDQIKIVPISSTNIIKSLSIVLALIFITMSVVEGAGTNIPVALAIIAPPFSLIWFISQTHPNEKVGTRSIFLVKKVISELPRFRNESLVFTAANMFGMGLSAMLPGNDLSLELNNLIPWPDLKLILLIFTMLGLSALGLHPVITVISVSAIFPPSSINIEPVVIALTYLGCWGLSTSISPFSGTTLFMSRVTGEPAHVVGWLWMPKMAVSGAIIVACSVILFRQLLN